MAPSQVSGMMMRNLVFGVILGLLAVVHSTPVNTVTQIPTKDEDEVFKEAVTEGYLVEPYFIRLLTTESPKRNTSVKASTQKLSSDSKERDMIEGSAAGDTNDKTSMFLQFATTTPSVSHVQSSASTVLTRDTVHSSPDPATSRSHQSSFTSSSVPSKARSSVTLDQISVSLTTYPAVSTFDFLSTQSSDLGSGDGEMLGQYSTTTSSTTSSSNTDTSAASSTSTAAFIRPKAPVTFAGSEGSGEGSGMEFSTVSSSTGEKLRAVQHAILKDVQNPLKVDQDIVLGPKNKEHSTPGWIMILALMVGFAALVMVFVALATRNKWSGPRHASQIETKTNFSNQQMGLEMETFLHKDELLVNGKAGDYTVIPLDEIPEKDSSH
ncbi:hypothetical protein PFLUV_G00029030 [Perca fluviatilis]|uniref:Uncharacterized protein n=1 Tax=Perca fluviatilis TaxID=8168 RepID=A0A6A5FLF7_PERFL|nr:uncharacterized serine-rich protein C215.13-like [Perca fluviatilis]KAF1392535.1 hypothetical protein PFLUV_G00029030 [Perca fluviatilis]